MGSRIGMLLVLAAAVAAFAVAGCGSDDETSATTSAETTSTTTADTSTTTTETTTASTGAGPTFEEASSALEADGFDLDDKTTEQELEQRAGLDEPITAVAGTDATRPGSSGDVLIFEFADEADAKAYAKVNNDDLLTTEVVGTLTLTSVTSSADLLDQALAAIGG